MMKNPTQEYTVYDQAYAYFNHVLFNEQLPPCLITLQHKRHTYGYYSQSGSCLAAPGQTKPMRLG
jgi:hypothetical protein